MDKSTLFVSGLVVIVIGGFLFHVGVGILCIGVAMILYAYELL